MSECRLLRAARLVQALETAAAAFDDNEPVEIPAHLAERWFFALSRFNEARVLYLRCLMPPAADNEPAGEGRG